MTPNIKYLYLDYLTLLFYFQRQLRLLGFGLLVWVHLHL